MNQDLFLCLWERKRENPGNGRIGRVSFRCSIFIDMFAPKWALGPHNLARFPSCDPCITPGYWAWYLNALSTSGSLIRWLFYAFMPREGIYTCVFCPPPPLSDENPVMLHFFAYAEIIFAHILVFPACAIEVQHIDENSPTINQSAVSLRAEVGTWCMEIYIVPTLHPGEVGGFQVTRMIELGQKSKQKNP